MENCNQLLPPSKEEDEDHNPNDVHFANSQNSRTTDAISTTMQKGFSSAPQKPTKPRKRKETESTHVHGGGARTIRSDVRNDGHSKVCTAMGTRDRRVRLSPKTAIEFYDVQDRLGYDRPSKAIDWLMNQARAAITALDEPPPPPPAQTRSENTVSSPSDGIFTNSLLPAGVQGFSSSARGGIFDEPQRVLSCNYENTPAPIHFPGPNTDWVLGRGQIIREPLLQSRYSRIISTNYYSPIRDISNEELQIFSIPEENEMDIFLHCNQFDF